MRQRLPLAVLAKTGSALFAHGIVGFGVLVAACQPRVTPVVPVDLGLVSETQVAAWVDSTVPRDSRLHKFSWLFWDGRASAGGKGSARLAPPDSLRFDAAGPYGSQPMGAIVIGDQPRWVEPPDALEKLVPNYPLFWAMFGVARRPDAGTQLAGITTDKMRAWRYVSGADTIEYALTYATAPGRPSKLVAEARRAGKVIGRAETEIGGDGTPRKSTLVVPNGPAKLDLTFLSTTRTTFAPDIWQPRAP